jgi:hypothetical protein
MNVIGHPMTFFTFVGEAMANISTSTTHEPSR